LPDALELAITPLGADLRGALEPLNAWSRRWAERA
jgi:DNA-binding HxlR family transcriptional regulator